MEEKKIKITYEELYEPSVDSSINQKLSAIIVDPVNIQEKYISFEKKKHRRNWIYILLMILVYVLLIWLLFYFYSSDNLPTKYPDTKYAFNKGTQILQISNSYNFLWII